MWIFIKTRFLYNQSLNWLSFIVNYRFTYQSLTVGDSSYFLSYITLPIGDQRKWPNMPAMTHFLKIHLKWLWWVAKSFKNVKSLSHRRHIWSPSDTACMVPIVTDIASIKIWSLIFSRLHAYLVPIVIKISGIYDISYMIYGKTMTFDM